MRVIYDYAAFVMQARGGVSRVLYELFCHVAKTPGIECRLFAGFHKNRYLRDAPPEVKKNIVGWYLPQWLVKQRIFMPINRWLFQYYAKRFNPEICHYTYFDTPEVPEGCKVVVTMHDMIHELFPKMFSADDPQQGWKKNAVACADGIICVSENTKQDLEHFINLAGKKVAVIHHGNSLASVVPGNVDGFAPFILYVGTRSVEYKNFNLVLLALAGYTAETPMHLVCFGGGAFTAAESEQIEKAGLAGHVHQMGGSDALLAGYYAAAQALIYPSKYEGFGLPPIEAMGFGCPVISSNAPPMPEIVGDAGLYFDPDNAENLGEQIQSIANETKRMEMVKKGKDRSKIFSWSRMVDDAIKFYRDLL